MTYYQTRLVQEIVQKREIWTASHPDLTGCQAVGVTPTIALSELEIAREEWLSRAVAQGRRVPAGGEVVTFQLVMDPGHSQEDLQRAREAINSASERGSSEQEETVSLTGEFRP